MHFQTTKKTAVCFGGKLPSPLKGLSLSIHEKRNWGEFFMYGGTMT